VRLPYASGFVLSGDYMYKFTDLGIWSTVEIGSALSASSLATLKPLFRKMTFISSYRRTGGPSGTSGSHKLPKGRFSMPAMLSGRQSKVSMPVRLDDVESDFPSPVHSHRMHVSITADDKNPSHMELNSFGIHKKVTVTQDV
jgi:hypothetical protein